MKVVPMNPNNIDSVGAPKKKSPRRISSTIENLAELYELACEQKEDFDNEFMDLLGDAYRTANSSIHLGSSNSTPKSTEFKDIYYLMNGYGIYAYKTSTKGVVDETIPYPPKTFVVDEHEDEADALAAAIEYRNEVYKYVNYNLRKNRKNIGANNGSGYYMSKIKDEIPRINKKVNKNYTSHSLATKNILHPWRRSNSDIITSTTKEDLIEVFKSYTLVYNYAVDYYNKLMCDEIIEACETELMHLQPMLYELAGVQKHLWVKALEKAYIDYPKDFKIAIRI